MGRKEHKGQMTAQRIIILKIAIMTWKARQVSSSSSSLGFFQSYCQLWQNFTIKLHIHIKTMAKINTEPNLAVKFISTPGHK